MDQLFGVDIRLAYLEVVLYPGGGDRLADHGAAELEVPTQHHVGNSFPILKKIN